MLNLECSQNKLKFVRRETHLQKQFKGVNQAARGVWMRFRVGMPRVSVRADLFAKNLSHQHAYVGEDLLQAHRTWAIYLLSEMLCILISVINSSYFEFTL